MSGLSRPAFVERWFLSVFRVSQAAGFSGARFLGAGGFSVWGFSADRFGRGGRLPVLAILGR